MKYSKKLPKYLKKIFDNKLIYLTLEEFKLTTTYFILSVASLRKCWAEAVIISFSLISFFLFILAIECENISIKLYT